MELPISLLAVLLFISLGVSASKTSAGLSSSAGSHKRATPANYCLPHRQCLTDTCGIDSSDSVAVVQRAGNVQIPFQWCPEYWGNKPKLCSQCGGDSKVKGTCDRILISGEQTYCPPGGPYDRCLGYFCKCSDDGGEDNSPKITTTTVVGGVTATGVWGPLTLSEYSKLRASTTVTLAETATASSSSELETVIAAIFAGGVAWYLASESGAIGAALALRPPPQRPEGSREDDQECSKPKEKCSDCGGGDTLGLCLSGSESGCPCDEQQCPKDKPPACTESECLGDDTSLKCSLSGKLQDCQCCPTKQPDCNDANCKANDNNICQQTKWKDCTCNRQLDPVDPNIDPVLSPPSAMDIAAEIAFAFSVHWGGKLSNLPGYVAPVTTPFCVHGGSPGPGGSDRSPQEWCACGSSYRTTYSVTTGSNACPFSPESTGKIVTFSQTPLPPPPSTPSSTPSPTPTPTPSTTTPTSSISSSYDPYYCGAPFCD